MPRSGSAPRRRPDACGTRPHIPARQVRRDEDAWHARGRVVTLSDTRNTVMSAMVMKALMMASRAMDDIVPSSCAEPSRTHALSPVGATLSVPRSAGSTPADAAREGGGGDLDAAKAGLLQAPLDNVQKVDILREHNRLGRVAIFAQFGQLFEQRLDLGAAGPRAPGVPRGASAVTVISRGRIPSPLSAAPRTCCATDQCRCGRESTAVRCPCGSQAAPTSAGSSPSTAAWRPKTSMESRGRAAATPHGRAYATSAPTQILPPPPPTPGPASAQRTAHRKHVGQSTFTEAADAR